MKLIILIIIATVMISCATKCYVFAPSPSGFLSFNQCTGQIKIVPAHVLFNNSNLGHQ